MEQHKRDSTKRVRVQGKLLFTRERICMRVGVVFGLVGVDWPSLSAKYVLLLCHGKT